MSGCRDDFGSHRYGRDDRERHRLDGDASAVFGCLRAQFAQRFDQPLGIGSGWSSSEPILMNASARWSAASNNSSRTWYEFPASPRGTHHRSISSISTWVSPWSEINCRNAEKPMVSRTASRSSAMKPKPVKPASVGSCRSSMASDRICTWETGVSRTNTAARGMGATCFGGTRVRCRRGWDRASGW